MTKKKSKKKWIVYLSHYPEQKKVTFRDNTKRKVIYKVKIGRLSNYFIDDVLLVKSLKYNLLSISQFYGKGN